MNINRFKIALLMAPALLAFGDGHFEAVKEGNRLYRQESYPEALRSYQNARGIKDSEVARYNEANAHYRLKEFGKASELYEKNIGSKNNELNQKSISNYARSKYWNGSDKLASGNIQGAEEEFKPAAGALKSILLKNPSDKLAKEYLEHTLAKLREIEKKGNPDQQQDPNKQDDKNSNNDQENKDDKNKDQDKKEKDDSENKDQKNSDNDNEDKDKNESKSKQKPKPQSKLNPDEVKRILKSIEQNEKNVQKDFRKNKTTNKRLEKDW